MSSTGGRNLEQGTETGIVALLRQVWPLAAVTGSLAGAAFGALAACALFWLVDFSAVPSDLLVLTFYAVAHAALAGVGAASLAAIAVSAWAVFSGRDASVAAIQHALRILLSGGVIILALGSLLVVAQRPTSVSRPGVILPILVASMIVAVIARRVFRQDVSPAVTYRPTWIVALLAVSLIVPSLFGWIRPRVENRRANASASSIERDPATAGRKMLLVGWDGATWDVADPLIREGRLPNLAKLVRDGSQGVLWASAQEIQPFADSASRGARSPALWETLATGKTPRQHGIWDFRCKTVFGVRQIVPFRVGGEYLGRTLNTTNQMARSGRVWNLLERANVPTAVIGWLSTWPTSDDDTGIVISDRATFGAADAVHPADIVDVRSLREAAEQETWRRHPELHALSSGIPDASQDESRSDSPGKIAGAYLEDYARDLFKFWAAKEIAEAGQPDFMAVVFRVTDVSQHKFWRFFQPELFGDTPEKDLRLFGDLIPQSYEFLDGLLGELIETVDPDTSVVVVSDHGAGPWLATGLDDLTKRAFQGAFHPEFSGNHRLNGIVALRGAEFRAGEDIGDARGPDLVPTILHFFGLPVADDMPGDVLVRVMRPGATDLVPVRFIASYETGKWKGQLRPEESEADEEILKRLKSLGYVE